MTTQPPEHKVLSALAAVLTSLGDEAVKVLWQGVAPAFYGYLIALIIMVFFVLITRIKSTAFSFKKEVNYE